MVLPVVHSRYSRNISLIGNAGQQVLSDSSVLVIGAGGLGSLVLYTLVANGIGTVGVMDHDRVSWSDLQRQILYSTDVINKLKVDCAEKVLNKLNPDSRIISYSCAFTKRKSDVIDDFDVIVDCSDNFQTKFLLNRECYIRKKALILASVIKYSGCIATFKAYLGNDNPCFQCFCPEDPGEQSLQSCEVNGVLNSVVATVASIQSTQVLKELLHISAESKVGRLIKVTLDSFAESTIRRDPQCSVCSS